MFKLVCITYKHFVGWLGNPSRDCTSITFVKLKECNGEFKVVMSLTISEDLSWAMCVTGKNLSSAHKSFATLPQKITSLAYIQIVIDFLDAATICVGNYDEKYQELSTCREGNFMNLSGMLYTFCTVNHWFA